MSDCTGVIAGDGEVFGVGVTDGAGELFGDAVAFGVGVGAATRSRFVSCAEAPKPAVRKTKVETNKAAAFDR